MLLALANRDLDNVGCTLLRIDKGIDTGPIYGFYGCEFDEVNDTHINIQMRSVFENLGPIQEKLIEIASENAKPIDISGRPSAVWGQPGLTDFLDWKRQCKRAIEMNSAVALMYHDTFVDGDYEQQWSMRCWTRPLQS